MKMQEDKIKRFYYIYDAYKPSGDTYMYCFVDGCHDKYITAIINASIFYRRAAYTMMNVLSLGAARCYYNFCLGRCLYLFSLSGYLYITGIAIRQRP